MKTLRIFILILFVFFIPTAAICKPVSYCMTLDEIELLFEYRLYHLRMNPEKWGPTDGKNLESLDFSQDAEMFILWLNKIRKYGTWWRDKPKGIFVDPDPCVTYPSLSVCGDK